MVLVHTCVSGQIPKSAQPAVFSRTCILLFGIPGVTLYTLLLFLVVRGVHKHSSWTAWFALFKLLPHSTLQRGRGHSTFLGVQTHCNFQCSCTNIHVAMYTYSISLVALLLSCNFQFVKTPACCAVMDFHVILTLDPR